MARSRRGPARQARRRVPLPSRRWETTASPATSGRIWSNHVELHAAERTRAQPDGVDDGRRQRERTIVTLGDRLEPRGEDELPWHLLARRRRRLPSPPETFERCGRPARRVSWSRPHASERARRRLASRLDAVVGSANDSRGAIRARARNRPPRRLVVRTEGSAGGSWETADGDTAGTRRRRHPGRSSTCTEPGTASRRACTVRARTRPRNGSGAARSPLGAARSP